MSFVSLDAQSVSQKRHYKITYEVDGCCSYKSIEVDWKLSVRGALALARRMLTKTYGDSLTMVDVVWVRPRYESSIGESRRFIRS